MEKTRKVEILQALLEDNAFQSLLVGNSFTAFLHEEIDEPSIEVRHNEENDKFGRLYRTELHTLMEDYGCSFGHNSLYTRIKVNTKFGCKRP